MKEFEDIYIYLEMEKVFGERFETLF